jgi:hypothetical protein
MMTDPNIKTFSCGANRKMLASQFFSMMHRTMQYKTILTFIVFLVLAAGLYATFGTRGAVPTGDTPQPSKADTVTSATATPANTHKKTNSYHSKEMGVVFEYPVDAVATSTVVEGTTGKYLTGTIQLSSGKIISFGAQTKDFTSPKGGGITHTTGYTASEGKYYFNRQVTEASLLVVERTILVDGGRAEAVLMTDTDTVGLSGIAAIINTKNTLFPGMAFQGSVATEEEKAAFESIVASVTLE